MKKLALIAAIAVTLLSCKTRTKASDAASTSASTSKYLTCTGKAVGLAGVQGVMRFDRLNKKALFAMYVDKGGEANVTPSAAWEAAYNYNITPSSPGVLVIQGNNDTETGASEFAAVGVSNGKNTSVSLRVVRDGEATRFDALECK